MPGFRYGAVFALTLVGVVWAILAPDAAWSRAVLFGLQIAALMVIVATSRTRPAVRRVRVGGGVAAGALAIAAVSAGFIPTWAELIAGMLVTLAIPIALVGGLLRLVRSQGVTLQAVA